MELTTPALLFPAVSLILLAYTNRFLALASVIRQLHRQYQEHPHEQIMRQIGTLRLRVLLVRNMQLAGVSSLFLNVLCMFLLFGGYTGAAKVVFAAGLLLLLLSLALSAWEIHISVRALNIQLSDIRRPKP